MPGTLNPPTAPTSGTLDQAAYVITGTGTTNDGRHSQGVTFVDPTTGLPVLGPNYNGATYDPNYGNVQGVLAPSAARTAAPAIATQTNPNHRGVILFLSVTASPADVAATLTLQISAVEPVSGTALFAAAKPTAISATAVANAVAGLYVVQLYPGVPAVTAMAPNGAAASVNGVLPRVWTASVIPANASSWNYSLAYGLLV